jgi:hypothetical protein
MIILYNEFSCMPLGGGLPVFCYDLPIAHAGQFRAGFAAVLRRDGDFSGNPQLCGR